jgi:hypothetical protein
VSRHLQKKRGFPDAGVATEERYRPRDDAAPEYPIQLFLATAKPSLSRRRLTIESTRLRARGRCAPGARGRTLLE